MSRCAARRVPFFTVIEVLRYEVMANFGNESPNVNQADSLVYAVALKKAAYVHACVAEEVVSSVWIYGVDWDTGNTVDVALYAVSGGNLGARVGVVTVALTGTKGWRSSNVNWAMHAGTTYAIAAGNATDAAAQVYWGTGDSGDSVRGPYATLDNPFGAETEAVQQWGMYATYALVPGGDWPFNKPRVAVVGAGRSGLARGAKAGGQFVGTGGAPGVGRPGGVNRLPERRRVTPPRRFDLGVKGGQGNARPPFVGVGGAVAVRPVGSLGGIGGAMAVFAARAGAISVWMALVCRHSLRAGGLFVRSRRLGPLYALSARGQLGKVRIYAVLRGRTYVKTFRCPRGLPSGGQAAWRAQFSGLLDNWNTLTAVERRTWGALAERVGATWISAYLGRNLDNLVHGRGVENVYPLGEK